MKFNLIHLLKILAIETFYIFGFYIYYSAFVDSFLGLNVYNYTVTNFIVYILLLSVPLSIYNIFKAYKFKKDNQVEKSTNFIIAQLFFTLLFIIF
jgi:hypothetical protein